MNVVVEIQRQIAVNEKMNWGFTRTVWLSHDAYAILCADLSVEAGRRMIPKIYMEHEIKYLLDKGIRVIVK